MEDKTTKMNSINNNKKPFYKKVWFWIIIAVVIIGLAGTGNDSEESSKKTNTNNSKSEVNTNNSSTKKDEEKIEYLKTDVDELEDALKDNAAKAKETYNNKYLEISGKVGTIDSDLKYLDLLSTTDEFDFSGIYCKIKDSNTKEKVKTLSKDQEIVVKGKIVDVGEFLGYRLNIDEIITK